MNWRDPKKHDEKTLFGDAFVSRRLLCSSKAQHCLSGWPALTSRRLAIMRVRKGFFARAEAPQVGCQWSSNVSLERRAASPPINSHVTSISWDASRISIGSVDGCHGKLSGWRLAVNDRAWSQLQPFRDELKMCENDVIRELQPKSQCKAIKAWLIDAPRRVEAVSGEKINSTKKLFSI